MHATAAGSTRLEDVEIIVGEFYVLEGSNSGRKHAELDVATRVAGREVARVTRRFRQMRTLQQQLRGSYGGGNLDLFLPSPGALLSCVSIIPCMCFVSDPLPGCRSSVPIELITSLKLRSLSGGRM